LNSHFLESVFVSAQYALCTYEIRITNEDPAAVEIVTLEKQIVLSSS